MVRTFKLDDRSSAVEAVMGVEIMAPLGEGIAGCAYMLEDERVLKLTLSRPEAALAAHCLAQAQGSAGSLASDYPLPRFDALAAFREGDVDYWGIVREWTDDMWPAPSYADLLAEEAWDRVHNNWGMVQLDTRLYPDATWLHGYNRLAADLARLASRTGIEVGDCWARNLGYSRNGGHIVVRDLSHVSLPQHILDGLKRVPVKSMPAPALQDQFETLSTGEDTTPGPRL